MQGADEWIELQEALLEPAEPGSEKYKEQKKLIAWYDKRCSNANVDGAEGEVGDGFWRWNIRTVNKDLEDLDDMSESDFTEDDFAGGWDKVQDAEAEEIEDDELEEWESTETEEPENGEAEEADFIE